MDVPVARDRVPTQVRPLPETWMNAGVWAVVRDAVILPPTDEIAVLGLPWNDLVRSINEIRLNDISSADHMRTTTCTGIVHCYTRNATERDRVVGDIGSTRERDGP